jgi:hypothetical protein
MYVWVIDWPLASLANSNVTNSANSHFIIIFQIFSYRPYALKYERRQYPMLF